ncbi:hypothetical protein TNCV_5019731 [Trichonephila clavipes]|nr:hypothetical protein TNCV_5019731 [Trichonephila clavipes]
MDKSKIEGTAQKLREKRQKILKDSAKYCSKAKDMYSGFLKPVSSPTTITAQTEDETTISSLYAPYLWCKLNVKEPFQYQKLVGIFFSCQWPISLANTLMLTSTVTMPRQRIHVHYEQMSEFERGHSIGLEEAGWTNQRIACHLIEAMR